MAPDQRTTGPLNPRMPTEVGITLGVTLGITHGITLGVTHGITHEFLP